MKKISGSPLCNISNDNEALAASAASPTPGTCETSLDDKFLFNWVQKPECETISHVISHCGRGRGEASFRVHAWNILYCVKNCCSVGSLGLDVEWNKRIFDIVTIHRKEYFVDRDARNHDAEGKNIIYQL